jgi:hypothetical protein
MQNPIERHRKALEIAVKHEAVPMMLETLVRVAELLHYDGETQRPLEIVTLTLCYPMSPRLRARAEVLAADLSEHMDAHVVESVWAWTDTVTLDEIVESILVSLQ